MSLACVPGKILRGERITRADLFDAPAERMIAEGRIVVAAVSMFAAWINPELLAQADSAAFKLLAIYVLMAIALVVIRVWRIPGAATGYAVHTLDITFLFALSALTGMRASPFFAFLIFFVLLA